MKKTLIFAAIAIVFIISTAISQNFTYVGAKKCEMCHKTEKQGQQFPLWEGSKHAKTSAALTSPEAAEAAKALGVENPAEDPKCLKCHAPLYESAPDFKEEGVTCEVCHGPGSDYRKLSVMKDEAEAAKNGLILFSGPDAIKAQCLKCHENPHGEVFDFDAAWEKFKHPVPDK